MGNEEELDRIPPAVPGRALPGRVGRPPAVPGRPLELASELTLTVRFRKEGAIDLSSISEGSARSLILPPSFASSAPDREYCSSLAAHRPLGQRCDDPEIRVLGSMTSKASMSPRTSGSCCRLRLPM